MKTPRLWQPGRSGLASAGVLAPAGAGLALAWTLALAAALALAGAPPLAAQQDFSDVEFDVHHVSGTVYVLISGRGGNIGVSSGPDGAVMVDDQFAPLADKIRAALEEIGQTPEAADVKFLINTHHHGDHTGGNVAFGPASTIIAHANVRRRLAGPRGDEPGAPPDALPVITFDESVTLHFNGEEIRAFHIPRGHTDGDAIIWFTGSNVVHMGDDFFAGRFPYVDIASGGSVEGLERGIASVLMEIPPDAAIIPGHGPLSTVEDLELYHSMLTETIATVREKMERGLSLERIQEEGVAQRWASWGEGEVFIPTERWLATIHQSLSGSADGGYVDHGHMGEDRGHAEDHGHEGREGSGRPRG